MSSLQNRRHPAHPTKFDRFRGRILHCRHHYIRFRLIRFCLPKDRSTDFEYQELT